MVTEPNTKRDHRSPPPQAKSPEKPIDGLQGVHPDLAAVLEKAREYGTIDFQVISGVRTEEQQAELVDHGGSGTLDSRHITGHAVDLVPTIHGKPRTDYLLFRQLWETIYRAAEELRVSVEWGGNHPSTPDVGHFELPVLHYPKEVKDEAKQEGVPKPPTTGKDKTEAGMLDSKDVKKP